MPLTNGRSDLSRWNDERYTDVEGIGLVPKGPRSECLYHTPALPQSSQRQLSPRNTHFQSNQHQVETRVIKTDPEESKIKTEEDDIDLPRGSHRPQFDNALQYLEEVFAFRRQQMREEGERVAFRVGPDHGTRGVASRSELDQFYSRDARFYTTHSPEEQHKDHSGEFSISIPIQRAQRRDRSRSPDPHPPRPSTRLTRSPSPPAPPTETPECKCPINRYCPRREDHLIDCRTLVLEYQKWKKQHAERVPSQLPPDTVSDNDPPLSLGEVKAIIRLLDGVETRSRLSSSVRGLFAQIESWLRKMQNFPVTQEIVHESRVLERIKGFLSEDNPRTLDVPDNIIEDLTYLQRKWELGDFGVHATRGLVQSRDGGQYNLDPNWPFTRSDNFFGHGHLVNGQTWLRRVEMSRDGAHAPPVAGISGTKEEGARSVVMGYHDVANQRFYADIDENETIWYVGTALHREEDDKSATNVKDLVTHRPSRIKKNSKGRGPTNATLALVKSYQTGRPVRVFRSFRLSTIVPLRPDKGFRYDGLYRVTRYELLKQERQIYRFKMERLTTGQGPLRPGIALPDSESRSRRRR